MFVLNAYFCRELRFVAILRSKLRFLLRNTDVDSEFLRKKLAAGGSGCKCNPKCAILDLSQHHPGGHSVVRKPWVPR